MASNMLSIVALSLAFIMLPNAYHASADPGTMQAANGTNIMNGNGTANTMLNGTRMVTDSKMCLASVDRCVMVKMMHLSPKIQLEAGIGALDVTCNTGFQLVLKATDASPACVTSSTAAELVARGWALGQDQMTKIKMMYESSSQ